MNQFVAERRGALALVAAIAPLAPAASSASVARGASFPERWLS